MVLWHVDENDENIVHVIIAFYRKTDSRHMPETTDQYRTKKNLLN